MLRRLLGLPLRLLPRNTVVPVLRGPHRAMKWIVASGVNSYWLGGYEPHLRKPFLEQVKPGTVFVDVGANAGFYTLMASALVGPSGRVIAFEPLPRNLQYLHRHVTINDLRNVTVIEAAVSDRTGEATFREGAHPAMGFVSAGGGISVAVVTLDEVWKEWGLPPPDVIKIDVEGGEDAVLRGARKILSEASPVLFVSTHGYQKHQQCSVFLTELGYRLDLLKDGTLDGMYELLARKPLTAA